MAEMEGLVLILLFSPPKLASVALIFTLLWLLCKTSLMKLLVSKLTEHILHLLNSYCLLYFVGLGKLKSLQKVMSSLIS